MRRPRVYTPYDRERLVSKTAALITEENLLKPKEVAKILAGDDTARIEGIERAMKKAETGRNKKAAIDKLSTYQAAAVSQAGTYTSFLERLLTYVPTDLVAAFWAIVGVSSSFQPHVKVLVVRVTFPVFIGITFFWVFFGAQEVKTDKIPYALFQSLVSAFALAIAGLVLSGDVIVGPLWNNAYGSILLILSVVFIGTAESAKDWWLKVYDTYISKKENTEKAAHVL